MILDIDSGVPLNQQIYEHIKDEIISGTLPEGFKLPSTRGLAATAGVSRNTVESAYQQLYAEGYIESKAGSGYYTLKVDVIEKWQTLYPDVTEFQVSGCSDLHSNKDVLSEKNDGKSGNKSIKFKFKYGDLCVNDFPLKTWKKVCNKYLSAVGAECYTSYSSRRGEPGLKKEILRYLVKSRGVSCKPEQIIISSGMEYCLSLLCQLFRKDFNAIAMEDPGYRGVRHIFINNGYDVIPIGVGKDGINLEELEESSAKMVYVTPSHQFPTGSVMPIQNRLSLLEWAKRNQGIIIEDDYDSEFRYNTKPVPSLQGINPNESVIYIGTFSKALAPALRLNYMILPEPLIKRYDDIFGRYQVSVPCTLQTIMQHFIQLGYWEKHLRRISHTKKKKLELLIHEIHEKMGDNVVIHGKDAGLHILLEFNNGLTEKELIERAENNGVEVYPVSVYWVRQDKYTDNMILLGFGNISDDDIVGGIEALAKGCLSPSY